MLDDHSVEVHRPWSNDFAGQRSSDYNGAQNEPVDVHLQSAVHVDGRVTQDYVVLDRQATEYRRRVATVEHRETDYIASEYENFQRRHFAEAGPAESAHRVDSQEGVSFIRSNGRVRFHLQLLVYSYGQEKSAQ